MEYSNHLCTNKMKHNKSYFNERETFEKVYDSLKKSYGSNLEKIEKEINILKFGEEIIIVERSPISYTAKTYDNYLKIKRNLRKIIERMENEEFVTIKDRIKVKNLLEEMKEKNYLL